VTDLPNLVTLFPLIESVLTKSKLGLIYIDIENFRAIEALYGHEICNDVLRETARTLQELPIHFCGLRQKHAVCSLGGDDFLIFIDAIPNMDEYQQEYTKMKSALEEAVNHGMYNLELNQIIKLHAGYTDINYIPGYHIESQIYKCLKEATYAAKNYISASEHSDWQLMRRIINQKKIRTVYQPIVSLKTGEIKGYEALSRGPEGTIYEYPVQLFSAADKYNCLLELEELCNSLAVSNAVAGLENSYLFLNINPLVLNTLNYHKGRIQEIMNKNGISFSNVVLELTERSEIENYANLRQVLRYYRNQGFLIAIDDAGAGYSSLQAIAELTPEFVKMDMSLVRDIDKIPIKRAMMETFVDFCSKINSHIIAEGIETLEELEVLSNSGCEYGQGFFLARPGSMVREVRTQVREQIQLCYEQYKIKPYSIQKKIGEIVTYNKPIAPDMLVGQVVDMFKENKVINGAVVCRNMTPVGLVMRDRLFAMLGTRYGYDLFIKRPVSEFMDSDPLVIPWTTSLEDASRLVSRRLESGINDYLVITRDSLYCGIVSVAALLSALAKLNVEQAKDSNPLTGLQGNRCITERIINELNNSERKMMILYFDLDNFKAYNDRFGFEQGDRVLVFVAQTITKAVLENGNVNDLIGHVGGDDFLVVTTPDRAAGIANRVITLFEKGIISFYDPKTLQRGYIIASDREGVRAKFPVMSISIAGVSNEYKDYENHLELGEVAADIKKAAKSIQGNCYRVYQPSMCC
jgi:FOG: EAL domain